MPDKKPTPIPPPPLPPAPDMAAVVESLNVPVYWKAGSLAFSGCNRRFADLFNLKKEAIAGKTAYQLFPPALADLFARDEKEVLIEGKAAPTRTLSCVDPRTGEKRWYRFNKTPLPGGGMVGVCEDATENMENEEALILRDKQLERAAAEAGKANSAKSEFLSRMSHEIRTPMNAILGMTFIARSATDPAKIKSCLDKINVSGKHLLGIINDILDMSKIEADKMELSAEEFNLEKLLAEIINIIGVKLNEKKQVLNAAISRDLPVWFKGDALRLSQVLTNLLSNAVKFSPENSEIKLSAAVVSAGPRFTEIRFTVRDRGIGISPEAQAKLFSPFEQGEGGISRKFGGTGLGLAISKRIVNLMGGDIRVDSELGKGSVFTFTAVLQNSGRNPAAARLAPAKGLNVLAVDDSAEMLIYYDGILSDYGIPHGTAASADQALCMLEDAARAGKPYNIIFTDWKMPGRDGVELSRTVKAKYNCAIVLVSIADWSVIESAALDAGIYKFLNKPLFASSIVDTVNEIMGGKKSEPAAAGAEMPDFSGRRILLAEDVEVNVEIMQAVLAPTNLEIVSAENGIAAFEKVKASFDKPFDLILMDVQMPFMDGLDATRQIRALEADYPRRVPIVAMTASVFKENMEKCIAAGMNGHIGKPVDERTLIETLKKYIPASKKGDKIMPDSNDLKQFLPYIDADDGLNRVRGMKKLYAKLLKSYLASADAAKIGQIADLLAAGKMPEAQAEVHTLKGVSANLSVARMFELSLALETCIKEGRDTAQALFDLKKCDEITLPLINKLIPILEM